MSHHYDLSGFFSKKMKIMMQKWLFPLIENLFTIAISTKIIAIWFFKNHIMQTYCCWKCTQGCIQLLLPLISFSCCCFSISLVLCFVSSLWFPSLPNHVFYLPIVFYLWLFSLTRSLPVRGHFNEGCHYFEELEVTGHDADETKSNCSAH